MAYEVGLKIGENTDGAFTISKILTKEETNQHWCIEQGKSYPHDKAYEITLKCGKKYKTLNTQITKCIQANRGWLKCYNCDGNKTCAMDEAISHTLSRTPTRENIVETGKIYGNLKAIEFAFNAKRHNYWLFECTECGAQFFKIPTNVKDFGECICPNCNEERYKGPKVIKEYLQKHNFTFEKEKRFEDCRYKSELPFDFAVYRKNGILKCLIEFDGEQHYKFIPHWHGDEEGFKIQQLRDNIKTEYCKKKNIKLIRIPYTEFNNISSILDEEILFDFF